MSTREEQIAGAGQHHIWCNHFYRPAEDCKMCQRLRALYPEDRANDPDGRQLMAKYFPENIVK